MVWNSIAEKWYSSNAMILTLHRVRNRDAGGLGPNEAMTISPGFLSQFIIEAKQKGFSFHSLHELDAFLANGEIEDKKRLFVTIDDGYDDNYLFAWKVFREKNVPFTIYLTTGFPDGTAKLWWYALETILLENRTVEFLGQTYSTADRDQKLSAFLEIRTVILKSSRPTIEKIMGDMTAQYGVDWVKLCATHSLVWDQIVEMSSDPLVNFGVHTVSHLPLARLNNEEIRDEINSSKLRLESNIIPPVQHFAYPFGGRLEADKKTIDLVSTLGFKSCATTRTGVLKNAHAKIPHALPRLMLTEGDTTDTLSRRALRANKFNRFVTY
ncbi:polysaccharide deacetylase family protein [Bdellovibrio sp. HCB2-146]|uniref:polysaccharide deacetylase family protein n=1 Tax=Bdellovibrio sp. HCB2-146 TaxID=3394362 RepID=UPI0039BC898E